MFLSRWLPVVGRLARKQPSSQQQQAAASQQARSQSAKFNGTCICIFFPPWLRLPSNLCSSVMGPIICAKHMMNKSIEESQQVNNKSLQFLVFSQTKHHFPWGRRRRQPLRDQENNTSARPQTANIHKKHTKMCEKMNKYQKWNWPHCTHNKLKCPTRPKGQMSARLACDYASLFVFRGNNHFAPNPLSYENKWNTDEHTNNII